MKAEFGECDCTNDSPTGALAGIADQTAKRTVGRPAENGKEQRTENPCVGGSIPPPGTTFHPPKLNNTNTPLWGDVSKVLCSKAGGGLDRGWKGGGYLHFTYIDRCRGRLRVHLRVPTSQQTAFDRESGLQIAL